MKRIILNDLKRTLDFFLGILLVCTVLYIALCLDGLGENVHLTDNLDYIIPIIVIAVIYKNFKCLKIKDESVAIANMPISRIKLFKYKYILSLIQIGIAISTLFSSTIVLQVIIDVYYFPGFYPATFNQLFLIISLGIKIIFTFFLFNIFLYLFLKGKKVTDGFSYIIAITGVMTLLYTLGCFILSNNENILLINIVAPFNSSRCVTILFSQIISGRENEMYSFATNVLQLSIITIVTAVVVPLTFRKIKNFRLEDIDNPNNSKIFKYILLALSILSIFVVSNFNPLYSEAVTIIMITNLILYIMYCTYIERYKPEKKELTIYFIIFILGVFAPYFI